MINTYISSIFQTLHYTCLWIETLTLTSSHSLSHWTTSIFIENNNNLYVPIFGHCMCVCVEIPHTEPLFSLTIKIGMFMHYAIDVYYFINSHAQIHNISAKDVQHIDGHKARNATATRHRWPSTAALFSSRITKHFFFSFFSFFFLKKVNIML